VRHCTPSNHQNETNATPESEQLFMVSWLGYKITGFCRVGFCILGKARISGKIFCIFWGNYSIFKNIFCILRETCD